MTAARDVARLEHMLAQARKVLERARTITRDDLEHEEDLGAAVAWRLSVIGEAAARLSQATRDQHPEIPWTQIIGMRHRLIHGYDAIDLDIVWQTIQMDLPPLVAALEAIVDR
ncbi:MAG: DUF86 domain-containing protein [Pirellulales bacterium]|nr:DUF86 domain-containing protein [Pirellulales bacterium]